MKIMTPDLWKKTLTASAVWNWTIGAGIKSSPEKTIHFFFGKDTPNQDPIAKIMTGMFGSTITFFGLSYFLFSRNPKSNRGAIWLGMILKDVCFAVFSKLYKADKATIWPVLITFGDFLWSILFGLFLWDTKDDEQYKVMEKPW